MKPKAVVTSLPVKDLDISVDFYRKAFELEFPDPAEGMFIVELSNLSLFLIDVKEFENYSQKAGFNAFFPTNSVQTILSCAIENRADIGRYLENIKATKGSAVKGLHENEWGQELAYVQDPDGHLWELVHSPNK